MSKLKVLSDTFNSLIGRSGRHNKALRDITDLLAEIQRFYSIYNLQEESSKFESLLSKIGDAKFDLTNLAYHTRPMIKSSKDIKGEKFSPIIDEILSELENLRRALMNPALRKTHLRKTVSELHKSVTNLRDKLSEIEYK